MTDAKRPEGAATNAGGTLFILPLPESRNGRALQPLWWDLIMKIWGEDPHKCPCCPGTMKVVGTDATSFSMRPIRSPRRSGRSRGYFDTL